MDRDTLITTIIIVTLSYAVMMGLVAMLRKENSFFVYTLAFLCGSLAFVFTIAFPFAEALSIISFNFLILLSIALFTSGIRMYFALKPWPRRYWVYNGLNLLLFIQFTLISPSMWVRIIVYSIVSLTFFMDLYLEIKDKLPSLDKNWRTTITWLIGYHMITTLSRLITLTNPEYVTKSWLELGATTIISLYLSLFAFTIWVIGIVLLDTFKVMSVLKTKNDELSALAMRDALTGLPNRNSMEAELAKLVELAKRYGNQLSFVLADIDHFKQVNDLLGHDTGDLVLRQTASIISKHIRVTDSAFRWGGEEFLIVAPHTDLEGARLLAEKIRETYQTEDFGAAGKLTISLGVAQWIENEPVDVWFKRADIALYQAKSAGRNKVECWRSEEQMLREFARIDWQEHWNSGNLHIDREHRSLINATNELYELIEKASSREQIIAHIQQIAQEVRQHFAHEEEELAKIGYDMTEHSSLHRTLLEELEVLRNKHEILQVENKALFTFLIGKVIVGHLLAEDHKFYPMIQKANHE